MSPSANGDHAVARRSSGGAKAGPRRRSGSPLRWASLLPIAAVLYFVWGWLESIKHQHYVFEPTKLHALVKDSLAATRSLNSTDAIFDEILQRLNQDPKIARTLNKNSWKDENEWVFNNAGGAMGSMYIIHASITEYLIFFGTPIGTEGHTGRHTADDYFHILYGEQYAYAAGALTPEIYRPGDQHHLRRGYVKQYMMPETGCWALELAQGWIPPMMPFGLADTLFSTLDAPSFYRTVVITAREMLGNLLIGM
ncbi:C-8 sterol isomerase [Tilletia horrida]|nr:C-8 sterol isomerase [Tilletia horrida]